LNLPKLSIAAKLYAIFALLATVTLALAAVATINAHRHAALTGEFESAFAGAQSAERVNALIYAVVMETRGLHMSPDQAVAVTYINGLNRYNDRIGDVMQEWEHAVRNVDDALFREFSIRLRLFQDFRRELARRAKEVSLQDARDWGEFDLGGTMHTVLSEDLETLGKLYAGRAEQVYAKIDEGIAVTSWLTSLLGLLAIALAGFGVLTIRHAVTHPLAKITRVTEAVASGAVQQVPFRDRHDEIGALARSISVFQGAMRRNEEFNRAELEETRARAERRERMANEIAHFSADFEGTLAELNRTALNMITAASQLSGAADQAATRTASATATSNEASSNVRDIASAADELAASVNEIDRQVAQSTTVTSKAVDEAERTNAAVKELDEAAGRIGDVVRLINDIAEQTNLLALNATIEAARAGEAGRGFAVVAGEVKALAGQTAKATEEIGAQIHGMQKAAQRSIAAIGAIERTIRDIGDISGAIAAAVTQQGAATQEIARSVDIAALRTIETGNEMDRVNAATADTRTSAEAVRKVADDLGAIEAHIRGQVEEFFNIMREISPAIAACQVPASKAAGM
jgi:methyl-accepting chemotaxis protein